MGEIVFVPDAEGGGAAGVDGGGYVVVAIAVDDLPAVEACRFGEGVEHFGGGAVGGTVADFVAVGDGHRHPYSSNILLL